MFTGSVGPNKDTVIALDDIYMTSGECSRSLSVHCYFANTTCLWTNDPEGLQWFSSDSYSDHSLNGPANPENRGIDGSILAQYVWIAKGCVLHFSELLL